MILAAAHNRKFAQDTASGLGYTQLAIGIFCSLIGLGSIFINFLYSHLYYVGYGIWSGVFVSILANF